MYLCVYNQFHLLAILDCLTCLGLPTYFYVKVYFVVLESSTLLGHRIAGIAIELQLLVVNLVYLVA